MDKESSATPDSSGKAMERFILVTLNVRWAAKVNLGNRSNSPKAILRGKSVRI